MWITWNVVNTPVALCSLLTKFSGNKKDGIDWDADLPDLLNFIKEEKILLTDSMFSRDALDSLMNKRQLSKNRRRWMKIYAIKTKITEGNQKNSKLLSLV